MLKRAYSHEGGAGPPQHWHLGVLTRRQGYVGLEQSDRGVTSMVHAYVDKAASRGAAADVAGRRWSTYTDSGGDVALVRRVGRTTTLVVGKELYIGTYRGDRVAVLPAP